jgi:hypothetical protein
MKFSLIANPLKVKQKRYSLFALKMRGAARWQSDFSENKAQDYELISAGTRQSWASVAKANVDGLNPLPSLPSEQRSSFTLAPQG